MKTSISNTISKVVGITLLITISVMLVILLTREESEKIETAHNNVKQSNKLLIKSFEFAMASGATDVTPLIQDIEKFDKVVEIKITPTNLIEKDSENKLDADEKKSLTQKVSSDYEEEYKGEYIYRTIDPILADNNCTSCHTVTEGQPLAIVSTRYSLEEDYASIRAQRIWAIVLSIIIIGITFAILMNIVKKRFITRVNTLDTAAKKITEGDLSIKIDCSIEDEIGSLAGSFNQMISTIKMQLSYLDKLPTPVLIINKDYKIQYINDNGAKFLNSDKSKIIGQNCCDKFKTDDCQTENCALYKAMKFDSAFTNETIARGSGKEVPILYTGNPLKNDAGEIIGAIEFVADITDIKNMQNYLSRSTKKILEGMTSFGDGDLTVRLTPEKTDDEIGRLFAGFSNTVGKFHNLVEQFYAAVNSTVAASQQINSTTRNIASGINEQTTQTADIAGAIEEMTATILDTSKNASNVAQASKQAVTQAEIGNTKTNMALEGMNKIVTETEVTFRVIENLRNKTDQIGEITQVINDIAEQTNLLALNAAIEAARAGEQGRGFAVVADEVRKLAERTTKATKEISSTISSIQTETKYADESIQNAAVAVKNGVQLSQEVSDSLKNILLYNERLISEIEQLASATDEQSRTAEHLSRNIESINSVANDTSIGITEVTQAMENLNSVSIELQNSLSQFKLNGRKYSVNHQQTVSLYQ